MRPSKRSLFYIGVWIGAVILVLSPFVWYHQNLPIPGKIYESSRHPVGKWFLETREDILWKKFSSRTLELSLPGTRWQDRDSGAIVEFGEDGIFRWIARPYPTVKLEKFDAADAIWTSIDRIIEKELDGVSYTIQLDRNAFMSWDGSSSSSRLGRNVFFETGAGIDLKGLVGTDGNSLGFSVWDANRELGLIFERQISSSGAVTANSPKNSKIKTKSAADDPFQRMRIK